MQEDEAEHIVAALRTRGVVARVRHTEAFRCGIAVPLGDGREAQWDVDGAAGLEAQVLLDGVLVGFVPVIPGSEDFDPEQTAQAIAAADYGPAPG